MASARRGGLQHPVTVTLTWRGGSEGWVEIRRGTDRWFRPYTHCIGGLVEECIRGGHWVEDAPLSAAVAARRRKPSGA